jgi:hypothetical protein
MRRLVLTVVAAGVVSATAFGVLPQVRLGECHAAAGISVQHKDGTYWCVGGIYNGLQILIF